MSKDSTHIEVTVKNAQTGEPMDVVMEVGMTSIVLRAAGAVTVAIRPTMTVEQAKVLTDQLTRVLA